MSIRRTPPEARVRDELAARRSSPPGGRRAAAGNASPSAGVERRIARLATIVRVVDLCIVPVAFGAGAKLLVEADGSSARGALGVLCIAAGLVAGWLALDDDGVL